MQQEKQILLCSLPVFIEVHSYNFFYGLISPIHIRWHLYNYIQLEYYIL